jgi:hypothetical protein
MSYPVLLQLYKHGNLFTETIAKSEDDLYCRIEMDTGTGWIDAVPLFQKMVNKGCEQITSTIKVCHSYEKWGKMQQEAVEIKVRLKRLSLDKLLPE